MKSLFQRFTTDSSGATAIEYALLAMLACLAPMAILGAGGEALAGLVDQAAAGLAAPRDGINTLP